MTYYSQYQLNTMSYRRSLLMFYSLRHIAPESKFCHALHLDVFEQIIPAALIRDVLTETQSWEDREKALNMPMVIVTIIAMGLFAPCRSPTSCTRSPKDCATSGLSQACVCRAAVPSASVVSSWACGRCVACSSVSASPVRPKRHRERLPSGCA